MHPMKPRSLSLLLPSSLAIDASDLRSKTAKIGQIARAASVFRADRIVIYRDPDLDETELIERILNYAETPQYLRKRLFHWRAICGMQARSRRCGRRITPMQKRSRSGIYVSGLWLECMKTVRGWISGRSDPPF